jgi:hypothetical protein
VVFRDEGGGQTLTGRQRGHPLFTMIVNVMAVCEALLSHPGEVPAVWNNGKPESRLRPGVENINSTAVTPGNAGSTSRMNTP